MKGPHFAVPLDHGKDGVFLRRIAIGFVTGLAADIAFVGFDYFVRAANRPGVEVDGALAEPVEQESCGFVGCAEHTLEL